MASPPPSSGPEPGSPTGPAPSQASLRRLPPGGTLAFLFSDIEGSTRLLQALGDRYDGLLATHDRIIRETAEREGGSAFGSEGDAQNLVFPDAAAAVRAALAVQRALATTEWPDGLDVRVRMGIHAGEVRQLGSDYVGLTLHETARITAAGHGGQVLLSAAAAELARGRLPEGIELTDLGEHRLKDLASPVRLYQLAGEGLAATHPPLRTMASLGAHLPTRLTSFVGREEVETVARLLDHARLVTLTGPGGTGKTRLATEVAAEVSARYVGGSYFVALDTVTDPELVASEIASALDVAAGPGAPIERLVAHLRERRVLVVLDNLEQVIEARTTVSRLLSECPDVTVLATSRIPLRVYGEQEFPVPALSLPPPEASDVAEVAASEAVRLFVERAMAVRPDFVLDPGDAEAVADIVRQLDGLPLAIELAAARLRILPVDALRQRLGDRLALLTSGAHDLPARQRTLRGAIEWSHELLDDPDRRLFARFSILSGGATFEDAEHVCGPESELGRMVFDGLESLAQQSLLDLSGLEAEPRVAMLATIREFAADRLAASGESDLVARRHAEAYLALAEEAAPSLTARDGQRWNDRLEREHDNLRAALDWIVREDEGALGLRMIAALWRFWQVRGHLLEGEQRAEAVLALPSVPAQDATLRAHAESAAGGIAYWRSKSEATHRHYLAALEAARQAGDAKLLADATYDFAFATTPEAGTDQDTRYRQGRASFEEALALYRQLGDESGIAKATWGLAMSLQASGDPRGAAEHAEVSLRISRSLGDPFLTGWSAHLLGMFCMFDGRPRDAGPYFLEALTIFTEAGDQTGILFQLSGAAAVAKARGDDAVLWRLIGTALRIRDETGAELLDETQAMSFLGIYVRLDPETDQEREWLALGRSTALEEAIDLAREFLSADK